MNRIIGFFSARSIPGPPKQEQQQQDKKLLNESALSQSIQPLKFDGDSSFASEIQYNRGVSKSQYIQNLQTESNQPIPSQKLEVDPRIKTVRLRLLDPDQKSKNSSVIFHSNNLEIPLKMTLEVKAKDSRFKELGKVLFIFYTVENMFEQLQACSFLRGFKPFTREHISKCILEDQNLTSKKRTPQSQRYYITKNEEGEYHGQNNKNKTPEGHGIIYYKDGRIYDGEIKCRHRNGFGKCTWPNGASYEGNWKLDAMEGFGKQTDSNGDRFEGTFVNNIKEGPGKMFWRRGHWIEGVWRFGQTEGESIMYSNGGQVKVNWKNGQIVDVNNKQVSLAEAESNIIFLNVKQGRFEVTQTQRVVQSARI